MLVLDLRFLLLQIISKSVSGAEQLGLGSVFLFLGAQASLRPGGFFQADLSLIELNGNHRLSFLEWTLPFWETNLKAYGTQMIWWAERADTVWGRVCFYI